MTAVADPSFGLQEAKFAVPPTRPGTVGKADVVARLCGSRSPLVTVLVYDRQTRSMLQTADQPMPSLGSQSGAVEQNADGSTDVYFGPRAPAGKERNWIQTVAGKGWFPLLRLYSPLQPFFDKTWRAGEIEPYDNGTSEPGSGR